MELLGIWKLKEMVTVDENGFKMIGVPEIEAMEDTEENKEFKQMVRAEFIISETSLSVYYMPLETEMAEAIEEGWDITEHGICLDSFPTKIENDQLMINYEKDGKDYFPLEVDGEGCLSISGGIMKIQKA